MQDSRQVAGVPFGGTVTCKRFDEVQRALLPWWTRPYVIFPALVFLMIGVDRSWSQIVGDPVATLVSVVWAVLLMLALRAIAALGSRRSWRRIVELHGRVSGEVSDSGVRWATGIGSATFSWDKISKVRERQGVVLLFYSPRCAIYFPREFFETAGEWDAFRALVAAKLPSR
jgi:hypothetical protein